MPRGRRPLIDKTVRKRISVPVSVADKIDIVLTNPLSGGLRYNAWADYVNKLIRDDLEKGAESVLASMLGK